ncbi:hypothetical protein B0H19DRAFT_1238613 [Mycena capillaripes]|nr:hypothetical protein B0H19DRAFT_1238613 [Mycena capillaripes]
MQLVESPWSRIPPEIEHEIAAYNATDVPSLHAMCLVSKRMRSCAVEHLFSRILFSCAQDFAFWHAILRHTPRLETAVKTVKFSDTDEHRIKRHESPRQLRSAVVPPEIPVMPNVRVVEWDGSHISISMAVSYLALFPNIEQLHLRSMSVHSFREVPELLGSCGRLKVLSLSHIIVDKFHLRGNAEEDVERPQFDLTALEELKLMDVTELRVVHYDREREFIVRLIEESRPLRLKSLTLVGRNGVINSSVPSMEKLWGIPSLVNLVVEPTFKQESENARALKMLGRLPFPALDTLSIPLGSNRQVEQVLNALNHNAAPNLTKLTFRIHLAHPREDDNRSQLDQTLSNVLPWRHFEAIIMHKFPLIRRIAFNFCVPRNSALHFRRGFRRRMERRLKERLAQTGVDVAEYLELEWLDEDYNIVVYSKTNGKPKWKRPLGYSEPDTEASDCGSDTELQELENVQPQLMNGNFVMLADVVLGRYHRESIQ